MAENASTDDGSSLASRTMHLFGRLLFGGVLTVMGLSNLRDRESQVAYAKSKDVPAADASVPFASGLLTAGGLGIALWRRPALAAAAVATFLAGVTPTMHDFWNLEDDQRESEQISFLQNLVIFGGALAFLTRALRSE